MLENERKKYDIIVKYIEKYKEKKINKGDSVSLKNF